MDFTEDQLAKKVRHGLKWRIFELEKGKRFRNYLLSVLRNVARSLYNERKSDPARSKSSGFWRAARPPMSGKG